MRGMGVLGLGWSTRPKFVMKMVALGLPMARILGLSRSPGPSMLMEDLMLPMPAPSWPKSMLS